jgi:transcriptional regulator with XRE-family HTH domain
MDKLNNRIVALRKQNKVTQEILSKAIGVSRTTLAHYEIGRRKPDYEILQKIADFFSVSTDYLLGRNFTAEEQEAYTKIQNNVPLDKIAAEHEISFNGQVLNQAEKEQMLLFVETLLKMKKSAKKD